MTAMSYKITLKQNLNKLFSLLNRYYLHYHYPNQQAVDQISTVKNLPVFGKFVHETTMWNLLISCENSRDPSGGFHKSKLLAKFEASRHLRYSPHINYSNITQRL